MVNSLFNNVTKFWVSSHTWQEVYDTSVRVCISNNERLVIIIEELRDESLKYLNAYMEANTAANMSYWYNKYMDVHLKANVLQNMLFE